MRTDRFLGLRTINKVAVRICKKKLEQRKIPIQNAYPQCPYDGWWVVGSVYLLTNFSIDIKIDWIEITLQRLAS